MIKKHSPKPAYLKIASRNNFHFVKPVQKLNQFRLIEAEIYWSDGGLAKPYINIFGRINNIEESGGEWILIRVDMKE